MMPASTHTTPIVERAARWRADADPEPAHVATMDQRVAERIDQLRAQGASVRSGRTAGGAAMLAVQSVFTEVTKDPRAKANCPCCETYPVLIEKAYAEGEIAAHLVAGLTDVPEPAVLRGVPAWWLVLVGVLASFVTMLMLAGLDDVLAGLA
jgi:hypothetical protein